MYYVTHKTKGLKMFNGKVIQDVAVEKALSEVSASSASAVAAVAAKVPDAELPTAAGNYALKVEVADEVVTYSWVALV